VIIDCGLAAVEESGEVVSGGGECPFDADSGETAPPKPTHAALLLQDAEYRFD
jgi:hypothetical protein